MRFKFKRIGSGREITVNVGKYLIDWDKKCRSKFQFDVNQWFRKYWKSHICLSEMPVFGSKMSCDLVNLTRRVVCEMNGIQHDQWNSHFQPTRLSWLNQMTRDEMKRERCEMNNLQLVVVEPDDVLSLQFFRERFGLELP